jgi:hypothetical protein
MVAGTGSGNADSSDIILRASMLTSSADKVVDEVGSDAAAVLLSVVATFASADIVIGIVALVIRYAH